MNLETRKQNALRAPAKDPCLAWRSSWAASLEEELVNKESTRDGKDVLW